MALALFCLGLGVRSRSSMGTPFKGLIDRQLARHAERLRKARIPARPESFFVITVAVPAGLFAVGWLESPALALFGGLCGLLAPRLYLAWLIHAQARRSEAEAPRVLQSLLTTLSGGGTYLDGLRQARQTIADQWIREDLDFVIQRFLLNVPLHDSIRELRSHVVTRNLRLIWEAVIICSANQLPTPAARALLYELSGTVQFNVQLANEVKAKTSGQRLQIWFLAIIVPGMYLYLRLLSPELLQSLDQTTLGRYVLIPTAAFLELLGIYLSFRIARFEA